MSSVHEVELRADDQRLAATVFEPETPNGRGILFLHGWRSSQFSPRQFARKLSDYGFTCMPFDMRGVGDSDGDILKQTRVNYVDDCLAAYDSLASRVGDIAVVGSSFGAYLACLLTQKRSVSTLVLRVPANYPNEGFDQPQALLSDRLDEERWKLQHDQTSPSYAVDALTAFSGPSLIVEAENDEIVLHDTVMRYVNAARNGTHVVVSNAPHSLVNAELRRDYQDLLVDWFTKH
jgi:pimeloyl-ACP methyl ester carboxylesterase